jgi:CheY-specific phosphatase CheX
VTDTALRRALEDSILETLDAMFFTACLEAPEAQEGGGSVAGPEMAARVAFAGRPSGRLTVRMAESAARAIAAGFLGEEENAISERQIGDVLCELANMICGFVLSRVECAEEFRLGEPRLLAGAREDASESAPAPSESAARERRDAVVHAVNTGAGVLTASLEMEGCPP